MYWPVGAPKIYAASNHELARAAKHDDKSDDPSDASESAVLPVDGADDDGGGTENGNASTKKSDARSSKKSRRSDASAKSVDLLALKRDEHIGGEIVGVRLGRNGYLFATITRCTLTIWQTKVSVTVLFQALTRIAHDRRGIGLAVGILHQIVRRQLRRVTSAGWIYRRGPNNARIPDHLLARDRSFCAPL
jgi:hypothetical protein